MAGLNLQGTEWAVLSACDTGLGEIKAGEGVFGLRRAFQIAGARTVIMSLWSVEDQAARAWMRALYEGRLTAAQHGRRDARRQPYRAARPPRPRTEHAPFLLGRLRRSGRLAVARAKPAIPRRSDPVTRTTASQLHCSMACNVPAGSTR